MSHRPAGLKWLSLILVVFAGSLALFSLQATAHHCKGKHANDPGCGEPPPPPPPAENCANAPGVFPAFAYSKKVVTGKRRKQKTRYDLYLADSTGACSLLIFQNDNDPLKISYRQLANGSGRIVWSEGGGTVIQMLNFEIDAGDITTPLPLIESTIYRHPNSEPVGIADAVLSHDASEMYFVVEVADGQGGWVDSINHTDLSTCAAECSWEPISQHSNEGISELAINAGGNRIYYSSHKRIPDIYQVAFIENQSGIWSAPTDIVTTMDAGYINHAFGPVSVGDWEYPGSGQPKKAISVVLGPLDGSAVSSIAFDVFDIENCKIDPLRLGSCFGASSALRIIAGISLVDTAALPFAKFSLFPSVADDLPPNLLLADGDDIVDFDLDTQDSIVLLQGVNPDPAN